MKDLLATISSARAHTPLYGATFVKAAKPALQASPSPSSPPKRAPSTTKTSSPKQSDPFALTQKIQTSFYSAVKYMRTHKDEAIKYVKAHKVESALLALALANIAFLTLYRIDSSSPPHEWTLSGPINTAALKSSEGICSSIINLKANSILNAPNTPSIKINVKTSSNLSESSIYSFYNPQKINPLALLIHNNCQKDAIRYRHLVFDPSFETNDLISLVVAAASAHNTPLWIELTTLLLQNKGLNSKNENAKRDQIYSVLIASREAAIRSPARTRACLNSNDPKTAYDPSISLADVHKANDFQLRMIESPFIETYIQMMVKRFKSEIDLKKEPLDQSLKISSIYNDLRNQDVSGLILKRLKEDPVYGKYFTP